mmetsp:Transcript_10289/g.17020  ORF Transcript_10289/g.17020 Transcript_10289/m.17020 type:complete len:397 (+) Transcript_10289:192-1382(+)
MEAMTSPNTPFHSLPPPTKDTPTHHTKMKWSSKNKTSSTNNNGSLVQIFRRRRDNLAQRLKNSNKSVTQPQPLLPTPSKSSPDMKALKFDMKNIDQMSDQCKEFNASSSSPSRSLMSGDTAALSLSSEDSSSPVISTNKKIHDTAPPTNIYAGGGGELVIGDNDTEDPWVEFPTQSSFESSKNSGAQQRDDDDDDDFGSILASAFGGDDTNNDADARKCLFDNTTPIDFHGFVDDSSVSSSIMKTLQNEVDELRLELTQTKKLLETATATNEALNEAHDQKHKELEQLNQDMDKFSDVIMLCMQQLRKRNAALESENEGLKSSAEDMRARMNFLARCTEALNDAHDRKNEECEELKREMNAFAETFAAQDDKMQELEGRLRNVMAENEELKCANRD